MKNKFLIGYEIEGIFNRDFFNHDLGEYHNGRKINKFFNLQRDGSLSRDCNFNREICGELVSYILKTRNQFIKSLDSFKNLFSDKTKDLNQKVYFNKSCGCHFHISFINSKGKNLKFSSLIDEKRILSFRRKFFKELEKLNINQKAKEEIKNHYFRSYSQRSSNKNFFTYNRNKEFNLFSEQENKGLEWRSFNLKEIQTFKEFNLIMTLCYDLLKKCFFVPLCNGYKTRERVLLKEPIKEKNQQEPLIYQL